MKTVAVHNGKFHADDVFAIAILKLIFSDLKVIRTRDEEQLKKVDARVDVGFSYNPETLDFDHHQKEGAGERENGVAYASVGLIWKHYGEQLVNSKEAWQIIDESLIQPLDADDVGMQTFEKTQEVSVYTLPKVINRFNANWKEGKSTDEQFFMAVEFATAILQRELVHANNQTQADNLVLEAIEKRTQPEFIILPQQCPWRKKVGEVEEILYVVFPGTDQWCILATEQEQFVSKKPFPSSWRGLEKEELRKVTGVPGADFCHRGGFFFATQTLDEAIEIVKKSLASDDN